MEEKRTLRILFIGNSHTYFNDMPAMVAEKARKAGFDCEVTMIAHGGWYLEQHVQEPDVRFNILYGHYDYVVLQEFSHPFGPEEKFFGAVRTLNQWIREAKSKPGDLHDLGEERGTRSSAPYDGGQQTDCGRDRRSSGTCG